MGPLVDGVDHVYVPMAEAATGFGMLTEELGLPVLWPFSSFGSFSSGGVSVGSVKLEIIDSNAVTPWSEAHRPPRIQGIAFRPSRPVDQVYLTELDQRGIGHSEPAHFERDGRPAWTNVYLTDLVSESAGAFVCDYHLPGPKDIARRRQALADCGGGRLGILDAVELVVVTRDVTAARDRWQALFDPLQPVPPMRWRPAVGPAVTLSEGDEERVGHLLLAVRSPAEAHEVWRTASPALRQLPLRLTAGRSSTHP